MVAINSKWSESAGSSSKGLNDRGFEGDVPDSRVEFCLGGMGLVSWRSKSRSCSYSQQARIEISCGLGVDWPMWVCLITCPSLR